MAVNPYEAESETPVPIPIETIKISKPPMDKMTGAGGGGFFPFWSLAVSREPIAEIIYPNREVEYYRIKIINREFFIIDKVGVFRIQDGVAKIYNGKVRIYQYMVESMNPIDPRFIPEIYAYCKKHKLSELLPIMLTANEELMAKELNSVMAKEIINDPISTRATIFLENFKNIDPVHVFNFYVTMKNAGKNADKLKSHRLQPKIEARMVMMLLVGGAIAVAIIVPTIANNAGSIDIDFFIPRALKGEQFLFGLKTLASHLFHFL